MTDSKKERKVVIKVAQNEKTEKPDGEKEKVLSLKARGKFNIIVTFNPNHSDMAVLELSGALSRIGEKPKIAKTESDGILRAAVSDARKVVARLRKLCEADPNLFSATYHYTPVDVWCPSDLKSMQKCSKEAAKGITHGQKWKLQVNKRLWKKMNELELIKKLTEQIDLDNVDLNSPQKTIVVEIIGKETGISLVSPEDTLNISQMKG